VPPIPGLVDCKYTTNETLFELEVLPPRMTVIGCGPIGLEMAQAFSCMGSVVTCLEFGAKILPREDPDAALLLQQALVDDGVNFMIGTALVLCLRCAAEA
jgi:pyruvate/2-oxoglutarate dehydrogenase complex dihydrolipoamide dehydrogenase (E3) component